MNTILNYKKKSKYFPCISLDFICETIILKYIFQGMFYVICVSVVFEFTMSDKLE